MRVLPDAFERLQVGSSKAAPADGWRRRLGQPGGPPGRVPHAPGGKTRKKTEIVATLTTVPHRIVVEVRRT